ncbi:hotdog family protein [Pseudoalteromonas aliena]|nr:hotdog family protein [Pseudoalteromonas aliena]
MTNYPIEQVVPHDSPMILIESLLSYSEDEAQCGVTVTEHSPFFSPVINGVPSYVGIEYMAQSIAAYAGALANDGNKPVKIGFLIGTRKYQTYQPFFKKGSKLTINAHKLYQDESGLSVFECQIHDCETVLCQAKINVFQPKEPLEFIRENQ